MIKYASMMQKPRLRVRRLDVEAIARRALAEAANSGTCVAVAEHGGSVANSYKYPAETECALVIASPEGTAVVFCGRRRANKVTLSGVARELCPQLIRLFDRRFSNRKADDRELRGILNQFFSPLEALASV